MKIDDEAGKEPESDSPKSPHLEVLNGVDKSEVVSSPTKLILSIMACVFAVEAIIMFFLSRLPQLSISTEAFIDALLLTFFLTPIVYLLIYRQLNEHIKKRHLAESAHLVSAKHLRSVVESAAEPIISMDSSGNIIFWNAVAERVFGYTKEDILGKSVTIIISDEQGEGASKVLDRLKGIDDKKHTRRMFEEIAIRRDGSSFPIEFSLAYWRTEDGEFYTAVIRDISEQKKSDNALKERTRQQAAVAVLGQMALSGIELSVLFDKTARSVAATLRVEFSKVLQLLPDQKSMLLIAGVGWKDGLVGSRTLKTGLESQAGYTLTANEPVVVEDFSSESRFNAPTLLLDHKVLSGMSVIIGSTISPFGVLGIHSSKKRVFNKDDVNFLQAVANVLAEAVRAKETEESFQALFKSTAGSTGEEFFFRTVESIKEWLDVDCVIIGEFVSKGMVETLSMIMDNKKVDKFSYELKGSPCEQASTNGFCAYPAGIVSEFPDDRILVDMDAQGYVGVSLYDLDGNPIGILCALSRSRLILPSRGREIFEIIAARVGTEMERRRAEESLMQSEKRFRDIANNTEVWIWEVDSEGKYTYASPLVEKILGYRAEEVVGKYFYDFVNPGERDKLKKNIETIFFNKELFKNVITNKINKAGATLVCETSGVPILDAEGKLLGYRGSVTDISERRKAEEEMRKLKVAIEQSPATVVITDVHGNIEYVNPKFSQMTGYTLKDVYGQNPRILKSGHTTDEEYKELWKRIKSGKEWYGEFLNRKKNGTLFWEAASISPVMDKEGNITNFIAVKEDITEKKRSESMITRIGRILENSSNEIYIFDASSLKYLEANYGARKNLGYSMKELAELTPVDLKPGMTRDDFEKILEPLRSGKEDKIEFSSLHMRKDGTTFPAEIHLQTTTFESSKAFVSIILDQTKRMEAEQDKEKLQGQLVQAQKMEAVGVLAAGVAHDFNNILTVIRLRAENAMEEVGEKSPAYDDMKEALEASKNASDLTRQLLLFSRKQAMEFINGDINVTIASLLKMLGRLIGENYSVKTEFAGALKHTRFDRVGVEQMIVNLAINSRDAMPEGGSITIKTMNVKIDKSNISTHPEARPGEFVCLSVTDEGKGMDKRTLERIFEPFYTTKGVGKGTGLGLAVVYGIIMEHKGWVEVSSEIGEGTTFDLYIPVVKEVVGKKVEKKIRRDTAHGEGRRILLVEDEAGLREITAKLLRASDFVVFEAGDYKTAREIYDKEKGKFNLLLSDVILPDKTGIQLAEDLMKKDPDLNLLLSSGYTDERSQWPLIRDKGYNFLQKPYSLDELIVMVMEVMEGA